MCNFTGIKICPFMFHTHQDYMSGGIDLNSELIAHPASTFFARMSGDAMLQEGIADGDLLVIDRSLHAAAGDMAVCIIDGEFTVRRLTPGDCRDSSLTVWGVIIHSIHSYTRTAR